MFGELSKLGSCEHFGELPFSDFVFAFFSVLLGGGGVWDATSWRAPGFDQGATCLTPAPTLIAPRPIQTEDLLNGFRMLQVSLKGIHFATI